MKGITTAPLLIKTDCNNSTKHEEKHVAKFIIIIKIY